MSRVWPRQVNADGSPGSPRAMADASAGPTGVMVSLTNSAMLIRIAC